MQTVEEVVGVEALNEWLDHPVTAFIADIIRDRADVAKDNRAECFAPGEPNKTQERVCYLQGSQDELDDWHDALNSPYDPAELHPLNQMLVQESADE